MASNFLPFKVVSTNYLSIRIKDSWHLKILYDNRISYTITNLK